MDKRALIGIALSILVLVVYQQLVTLLLRPAAASAPSAEDGDKSGGNKRAGARQAPLRRQPHGRVALTPATLPPAKSAKEITVETG